MRLVYSILWWLAMPLALLRLWRRGRKEPGYRQHWLERLGFYSLRLPTVADLEMVSKGVAGRRSRAREAATRPDSCSSAQPFPEQAAPLIWVHAVSVGETRAAEPLVRALLQAWPDHAILLTHMTPAGRATGTALFKDLGFQLVQSYLPYDTGWMTARFLQYFSPRLGIVMETEVWPNLLAQCRGRQIPMVLANARLSARSLRKAQRFSGMMREAARNFSLVAAQTTADAQRLRAMGAAPVELTGSLKFDIRPPSDALAMGAAWRQQFGKRPVLLCASTREGEEKLILEAFASLVADSAPLALWQQLLLVIVPRHPQRFDEVARLVQDKGLRLCRRSDGLTEDERAAVRPENPQRGQSTGSASIEPGMERAGEQTEEQTGEQGREPAPKNLDQAPAFAQSLQAAQVLLGDSMGEMFAYYAACDVAFIGGSLLPFGGQNLIEACAVGRPVLVGPSSFNFQTITEDAIAAGGARRVENATAMLHTAVQLLSDGRLREKISDSARQFADQHRGATPLTVALLRPFLENS